MCCQAWKRAAEGDFRKPMSIEADCREDRDSETGGHGSVCVALKLTQVLVIYEVATITGSAKSGRATISTRAASEKDMWKRDDSTDSDGI